jgi:septal ring factor EnvC (AmiA/AmiB activator)
MMKNFYKKFLTRLTAGALFCILFSLSSLALLAQDFSSLDSDLQQLEDLILDTIATTQEQQKLLDNLRQSLNESGDLIATYESIISEQETLLKNLQEQLTAMSETYRTRSQLSAKYDQRLRFWRNTTLIGIPAATLISAVVVRVAR